MGLTEEEKLIVLGEGDYKNEKSMLTDNHITEFNNILRSITKFSMQSPLFLQLPHVIKPVPLEEEYIQILFSGNNEYGHWICIYYNEMIIHVYDSNNQFPLQDHHKIFLNRLFPDIKNLRIVYEKVQYQMNSFDCGIYAIAFVIAILHNICPCSVEFSRIEMRRHLLELYNNSSLNMFPVLNNVDIVNINNSCMRSLTHSQMFSLQSIDNSFFDNCNFESMKKNEENIYESKIMEITLVDLTKTENIEVDNIYNSKEEKTAFADVLMQDSLQDPSTSTVQILNQNKLLRNKRRRKNYANRSEEQKNKDYKRNKLQYERKKQKKLSNAINSNYETQQILNDDKQLQNRKKRNIYANRSTEEIKECCKKRKLQYERKKIQDDNKMKEINSEITQILNQKKQVRNTRRRKIYASRTEEKINNDSKIKTSQYYKKKNRDSIKITTLKLDEKIMFLEQKQLKNEIRRNKYANRCNIGKKTI